MNKNKQGSRRWTRRTRILATTLALVLVGGIAWAAVLSRVGVQGNIGRGQFIAEWGSATAASTSAIEPDGTLTGQLSAAGQPELSADRKTTTLPSGISVFPGEAAVLDGEVVTKSGTTRNGYVSALTSTAPVPAGWEVRLVTGCGSLVTSMTPATTRILFVPVGETGTDLNLATLGLSAVVTALPAGQSTPPDGVTCAALGG